MHSFFLIRSFNEFDLRLLPAIKEKFQIIWENECREIVAQCPKKNQNLINVLGYFQSQLIVIIVRQTFLFFWSVLLNAICRFDYF